jgi:hypothetical protein
MHFEVVGFHQFSVGLWCVKHRAAPRFGDVKETRGVMIVADVIALRVLLRNDQTPHQRSRERASGGDQVGGWPSMTSESVFHVGSKTRGTVFFACTGIGVLGFLKQLASALV